MENSVRNKDCEVQGNNTAGKKEESSSQNVQGSTDAKVSTDSKNTQVRVVRGTKKIKVDISDGNNVERKGLYLRN